MADARCFEHTQDCMNSCLGSIRERIAQFVFGLSVDIVAEEQRKIGEVKLSNIIRE